MWSICLCFPPPILDLDLWNRNERTDSRGLWMCRCHQSWWEWNWRLGLHQLCVPLVWCLLPRGSKVHHFITMPKMHNLSTRCQVYMIAVGIGLVFNCLTGHKFKQFCLVWRIAARKLSQVFLPWGIFALPTIRWTVPPLAPSDLLLHMLPLVLLGKYLIHMTSRRSQALSSTRRRGQKTVAT